MTLAKPMLIKRLRNDMVAVEQELGIKVPSIPDNLELPIVLAIDLHNVEGYSSPGVVSTDHEFEMYLGADYPYERPKIRWMSPIFHPNIMTPEEGGMVCVMALDHWDFNSSMVSFMHEITELIKNPNPHDPLRSKTCQEAASWFLGYE